MANSFEDYQDLTDMGYHGGSEPVAPEAEFFHSVYIAGKTRKNHLNIDEQTGKIQVRGVEYNLNEVNMVITHTKDILCKVKSERGRDNIECFSYKDGNPWHGTSALPNGQKRTCPSTSAERATNNFCAACRSQIILAGIFCQANGTPILTEDRKPIFIFIRGKGTKYQNVSNYLNDRFKEDLSPIFEPVTEQSKAFEKSVVNNKRFVTRLTKGAVSTSHGNEVSVFVFEKGVEIPKDAVMKILKLSKDTLIKFNEKFDWSKGKNINTTASRPEGILEMGTDQEPTQKETSVPQQTEQKKTFSFDDIEY